MLMAGDARLKSEVDLHALVVVNNKASDETTILMVSLKAE